MSIEQLNAPEMEQRLATLRGLMARVESGEIERPKQGNDVNNHIHTTFSFSPYSPAKSVWMAYRAGLRSGGIMDHDSISGGREFIEAGEIIGMATTIGVECRTDFSGTRLNGRKINNPDQISNAYIAIHGIPHTQIEKVRAFFAPLQEARNRRNEGMVGNLNRITNPHGISLDYQTDVLPLSMHHCGGTVTERHLLFALGRKMIEKCGKGPALLELLKNTLGLPVSPSAEQLITDSNNEYCEYDLLGALKSNFVERFYIPGTDECADVREVLSLAEEAGAICAYSYLGDVGKSVTGDKKQQKFEDDFLELLFEEITDLGFKAVTYMPTRNTLDQLRRIKELCEKHALFQISGVDINSPRQTFVCEILRDPEFANLIESTWALIGHEKSATGNLQKGFLSPATLDRYPNLQERIAAFAKIGRGKTTPNDA